MDFLVPFYNQIMNHLSCYPPEVLNWQQSRLSSHEPSRSFSQETIFSLENVKISAKLLPEYFLNDMSAKTINCNIKCVNFHINIFTSRNRFLICISIFFKCQFFFFAQKGLNSCFKLLLLVKEWFFNFPIIDFFFVPK